MPPLWRGYFLCLKLINIGEGKSTLPKCGGAYNHREGKSTLPDYDKPAGRPLVQARRPAGGFIYRAGRNFLLDGYKLAERGQTMSVYLWGNISFSWVYDFSFLVQL